MSQHDSNTNGIGIGGDNNSTSLVTVNPNPPSTSAGGASKDKGAQFIELCEQNLQQATDPNGTPAQRLTGLGQLMALLVSPKNQALIGRLDPDVVNGLQQALFQAAQDIPVMEWLASLCGVAWEEGETQRETDPQATSVVEVEGEARRWTRDRVLALVNEPIEAEVYARIMGSKRIGSVYIHSNHRVARLMELMAARGPLTLHQMMAFLMGQQDGEFGNTAISVNSRIKQVLQLLSLKSLVSTYTITSPTNRTDVNDRTGRSANLWTLTRPGKIYVAMLNNVAITEAENPADVELQSDHAFGTNQVLAGLAGASAAASRLGVLDYIARTILKENPRLSTHRDNNGEIVADSSEDDEQQPPALNPVSVLQWARTPKPKMTTHAVSNFSCRVELGERGASLLLTRPTTTGANSGGGSSTHNRPDAIGRLVYDSELAIPTVLRAAQLDPDKDGDAAEFVFSAITQRRYWPFVLEYDRATESSPYFVGKVDDYTNLYNTIKTAWPIEWGEQFPVILVVVESSHTHLLTLRAAVKNRLLEIKSKFPARQLPQKWWFTTTSWFSQVFKPYLEPTIQSSWEREIFPNRSFATNNGRRPKSESSTGTGGNSSSVEPSGTKKANVKPLLAPDPRIWLPLNARVENHELLAFSNYLRRGSAASSGASVVGGLRTQPPPIIKSMRALPLLMPLNDLP